MEEERGERREKRIGYSMPSAHFSRPAGMSFVSGKKKTAGGSFSVVFLLFLLVMKFQSNAWRDLSSDIEI